MKDALKKTARWLVPLIIAAAILIYMYHDFDFRTVWQILTEETNVWWLFVSLIPILVSHILRGVRWLLTLEPIGYRPRTINSILSIYVAYASNIVIPRVGEISRCGVLAKYDGIPFSKSLGTLVAERIVDFIIAFSFCSIMLIFQTLVLVFCLSRFVDGDVAADGEAEGFDGFEFVPVVPSVPDLDHRLLYNILRLHTVESDAEGQSEEFILQWQDIVPETDLFHPLYY